MATGPRQHNLQGGAQRVHAPTRMGASGTAPGEHRAQQGNLLKKIRFVRA